jgi:hypothetical protein
MFGTIGHARLKSGRQAEMNALGDEWKRTIRPLVPGPFLQLMGNVDGDPDALVFVALAQDKATYQNLANLPEQDAWYRKMVDLIDGDVRWEDVEMDQIPD